MKPNTSLEEERAALLEQIHSSRAAYRRMLAQYDQPEQSGGSAAYGNDKRLPQGQPHVRGMPDAFPRSQTVRWVVTHPWAVAGVAAGLVALMAIGPRRVKRGVGSVQRRFRKGDAMHTVQSGSWRDAPVREVVVQKPSSAAGAAMASLMGLITMALRDPQRMRMAVQTATRAWEWMQARRRTPARTGRARASAPQEWKRGGALPDR
jgi:hypothetical protein